MPEIPRYLQQVISTGGRRAGTADFGGDRGYGAIGQALGLVTSKLGLVDNFPALSGTVIRSSHCSPRFLLVSFIAYLFLLLRYCPMRP